MINDLWPVRQGRQIPTEFGFQLEGDVRSTLSSILEELSTRFQDGLVSVVLFGSHARGNPRQHSDLDLVVVVKNLPYDWRERGALELSIERLGLKLGRAIQVILVEPADVHYSVETFAPLPLEIYDAHICLFDREGFFGREMAECSQRMEKEGVKKIGAHKWEVPTYAAPC